MPIKGSQEFPFRDGKTAFHSILDCNEYALALIDLMLSDMNGMEIIKAIRKVSTIPIIIITAKDNDTDKSLGLNLGADDYVVKPFSLIELAPELKPTSGGPEPTSLYRVIWLLKLRIWR